MPVINAGTRVKIKGTHPHSGETGVISRERSSTGGILVELEHCRHGVTRCMVFLGDYDAV